ncbi:putative chemotaxis protein-glutamate methylesterase [Pigmentiphaga litoralis]|uniref:chemotaxis protein CheB n=1 Tax=Pigmentiphaga litoralis TaxID=516702 RepID=UPI00167BC57B|nr:chemotaxis protein CheB [Pigmentiphaga litoralis]GGX00477.1 putative chemotaxis protein-glutamate methylesterase [Pigmentiphaga litoralis]
MSPLPELIVIGCSAGGLQAMQVVLAGLDPRVPVPVVIVTHTASHEVDLICDLLGRCTRLPVIEATERCAPVAGVVHIAPSGYHLLISKEGRFELSVDAKVCFVRPSIDVLFSSAAFASSGRLIGVVMTGANQDGAEGLLAVRRAGGLAIVQDPMEAEVPVMPQACLDLSGADHCLRLADIAPLINRIFHS